MSLSRVGAILAMALALSIGGVLVVADPAAAHGPNVKISENGSDASGRYWDGSANHTAPFYGDVTVHSNGTVTFWGTTVCSGTIVYSDGALNAYYHYQRIPLNVNDPIAQSNFATARYPAGGMHYSAQPAYCGQAAFAPIKPALKYQYIGTNTAIGSYSFLDGTNNTLYVFPPTAAAIKTDAQSHVVGVQIGELMFPIVAAGGGNILLNGCCNLVSSGGGNLFFRSPAGGNIVAAGGGNIVAAGGGNLISQDGSTLVRAMQSLVAAGGGNLVAAGGGNLLTDNGSGLVGPSGGTFGGPYSLASVSAYAGRMSPASIAQCSDNRISVAYALSGLSAPYALTSDSGKSGKCNPDYYLGGNYVVAGDRDGTQTVQALVQVIRASTQCYPSDPWIGEALWKAGIQRQAFANSCTAATYSVNGRGWSTFPDLLARVKAHYLALQSGAPAVPVDKYGCTPPNYGVALFAGNVFEPQATPNLNTSLAVSFRCSNQIPAGYSRPYPIPANLLIAVAAPPAAPTDGGRSLRGPANTAGINMPVCAPNDPPIAIFDPKYPTYFWDVLSNRTLDLHKATSIVCYSHAPKLRYRGLTVPPDIAVSDR